MSQGASTRRELGVLLGGKPRPELDLLRDESILPISSPYFRVIPSDVSRWERFKYWARSLFKRWA